MTISRVRWWCLFPMLAGLCWCQEPSAHKSFHPAIDAFAGYSYVSPDFGEYNLSGGEGGVDFSVDVRFTRIFAATVDAGILHAGYNPAEHSSTATILAGPRFFFPIGSKARFTPFADILGGVTTFSWNPSSTNPGDHFSPFSSSFSSAFATDAGLDLGVARHVGLRVQGGYLHSSFSEVYPPSQTFVHNQHGRMAVGVVWRF